VLQKSQFADERWQWAGQAVSPEVPATIPETNNVNYPIHLAMSLGDLELYIKLDIDQLKISNFTRKQNQ
jgi:hypothetical protein